MTQYKPGSRLWTRDKFGTPMSFVVDYFSGLLVVGRSNRGSFVRLSLDRVYHSLDACQGRA